MIDSLLHANIVQPTADTPLPLAPLPDRCCGNCEYFCRPEDNFSPDNGECRRYPPQIVVITGKRTEPQYDGTNQEVTTQEGMCNWPAVRPRAFCGEWKRKVFETIRLA